MMNIKKQIENYIDSLKEPGRSDIKTLHRLILLALPECKLCFLDGKNDEGKVVSNPNIGYGHQLIKYADGKKRSFIK